MWPHAAARRCFRRGAPMCVPACLRIHQPVGRDDLGAPSACRDAPGGGPARPGHRFLSERKRWERKGRGCTPGVPQTGAHGGGWLYGQGKNLACIAARFMGSHVSGAVAPWVARIAVTPQALGTCALYRVRPPGRRLCYASEKAWRSPGGRSNAILHLTLANLAKSAGAQDLHRPGCPPTGGLFSPH